MPRTKGAIYTRTSSKSNEDGASSARQVAVAKIASARVGVHMAKTTVETISGSLPLDKRTTLKNMIEHHGGMKTIFVEGSSAVARNAKAAEEVYELARLHGVTIIPADVPDLFQPNPTAVQKFVRRCIFAMTELERDLVVDRLRDGRTRATNKDEAAPQGPPAWNTLSRRVAPLSSAATPPSCRGIVGSSSVRSEPRSRTRSRHVKGASSDGERWGRNLAKSSLRR